MSETDRKRLTRMPVSQNLHALLNLSWSTGQASLLSGLMGLGDTAVTRIIGYYTDTQERVFCALPGIRQSQSVYRAELHAIARALEECSPHEVVSDCKGAVKAVHALQTGRRQPKGRNRDLERRVKNALLPGQRIRWIKAHLKQADVDNGRITAEDLQGNGQADILANEGTAAHGNIDPDWADFANKVFHFWRLVGPQLRERPEAEPRVRLPREPAAEAPE
eukprot:273298-Amphidinium_carterae.1